METSGSAQWGRWTWLGPHLALLPLCGPISRRRGRPGFWPAAASAPHPPQARPTALEGEAEVIAPHQWQSPLSKEPGSSWDVFFPTSLSLSVRGRPSSEEARSSAEASLPYFAEEKRIPLLGKEESPWGNLGPWPMQRYSLQTCPRPEKLKVRRHRRYPFAPKKPKPLFFAWRAANLSEHSRKRAGSERPVELSTAEQPAKSL